MTQEPCTNSPFKGSLSTRVIIHGWGLPPLNNVIRDALLSTGFFNVICVDWIDKSFSINYAGSRKAVPDVGRQVASFLDFLNDKGGMSFNHLTLIGHSLGAHVVGFAGKHVTRGKVNTIVGLDPAYPLFSYSDCSKRLCRSGIYSDQWRDIRLLGTYWPSCLLSKWSKVSTRMWIGCWRIMFKL